MYFENYDSIPVAEGLFSKVKFHVTGSVRPAVLDTLARGGAQRSHYLSPFTTHLIVGPGRDQDTVSEAEDMLDIPAVVEEWVLASRHVRALLPTKVRRFAWIKHSL